MPAVSLMHDLGCAEYMLLNFWRIHCDFFWHVQVAQESLGLSRVVRAFGTEERESNRYIRCLGMLRRISVRQATAYLLYLVTNASLFNLTKVQPSTDAAGMVRAASERHQYIIDSFQLWCTCKISAL